MLIILSWRPKGGAMTPWPPLKYGPDSVVQAHCKLSQKIRLFIDVVIEFELNINNSLTQFACLFRRPEQLYVWWTLESPLHTSLPSQDTDGLFNLTFSYKTDADVYAPYGTIHVVLNELKAAGETDLEKLLLKKRTSGKVAAWAVSNCYSKRMEYAKSLIDAGLKVDTFGSCFGSRNIGLGRYSQQMYKELSFYKFYFAFENSIGCKDYITEKFWFNGLRSGTVPIVWGPRKSDILKVAPSKSFIHSSDFETPAKLVEYLNFLVDNETAYAEYLQWRTWVNHPDKIQERLQKKNWGKRSSRVLQTVQHPSGGRAKTKIGVANSTKNIEIITRSVERIGRERTMSFITLTKTKLTLKILT